MAVMFNSAFTLVRAASRLQARSFTGISSRSARDAIAFTARDQPGKGSNGSQQSNKSGGHGSRCNGRLLLRSTAVAGFSIVAALAKSDDSKTPRPAFKHPSGWDCLDDKPSLHLEYLARYAKAADINSIEDARIAFFDFTRALLGFCVQGEVIDEGPAPSDIIFGLCRFVKKEDIRILWMPSPVQGRASILCLSVHHDMNELEAKNAFVDNAIAAGMGAHWLEKFKDGETYIHIFIHFPGNMFSCTVRRDQVLNSVERQQAWAI